jgi:hypothetical protein
VASDATTATKLPALTRKQVPAPTPAIMRPAMAGPIIRAVLKSTELRLTAFRRCSGPTISSMNDCRDGFSNALFRPSRAASTPISHSLAIPVTVSRPRISAWTPIALCSAIIRRRLSTRSATTPPYGASINTGIVCSATISPRSVLEWVRLRTSHDWPVICIQVPISEIAWPP